MATSVEINGVNFLSIKEASKLVSYSRDYVARLAREEKIVASQIGRQWFVDIVSLKNFAEVSELEQSVRKQQLSEERKREQIVKKQILSIHNDVKGRVKSTRFQAQLVAMMVLGFGLVSGAAIYTTSSLLSSAPNQNIARLGSLPVSPENVSVSQKAEVQEFNLAESQPTTLFNSVVEYPLFVDESETRDMSTESPEGIFLLSREGEVKNAEEVQALFSDDVEVEFKDDNTGVVTYTQENGDESSFPFVSLPVHEVTPTDISR